MASFLARTFSRRRPIGISEIPELQETLRRSLEQNRVNNTRYIGMATDKLELFIMKLFHSENDPVQNKDYALAYIRELKPHLPESAIFRMIQKANTLENTNNPEYILIECILSLRNINKQYLPPDQRNLFPIDTLEYTMFYPMYLSSQNIDQNRIPILVHNVTIFLMSLLENNTAGNIDRRLAQEYFDLFKNDFIRYPEFVAVIENAINELSNSRNRPSYLVNAIQIYNEVFDENHTRRIRLLQMLEDNINTFYPILSENIDERNAYLLQDVVYDMRTFLNFIISDDPIQHSLGLEYVNNVRELLNQPMVAEFEEYLSRQVDQPTDTNPEMNQINIRLRTLLSRNINQRTNVVRTPLKSIQSLPKTPITSSVIENDKPISKSCDEYINGFDPYFKKVETKLKKLCTLYTKPCDNLDTLKSNLSDYLQKYRTTDYRITNVNSNYTLAAAFKFWNGLDSNKQIKFALAQLGGYFNITYRNLQGVGIGVVRNFFQNCIDELLTYNVFGYVGTESIQRYQINPIFNPDETFKKESGLSFDKEADFVLFYKFIGRLLCFVLLNDIGLHFHLSHAILAHMIYKHDEITDDDYLGYFMLDYPEYFKSYVNLMKMEPDTIKDLGIEFNDDYDLVTGNKDVTKTNFKEYITMRSKHKLLHQIDNQADKDTYDRFKGLVSGFNPLRKLLAKERLNLSALDKLITFETINDNTIQKLINNFKRVMTRKIQSLNRENTSSQEVLELRKAYSNMLFILEDNGATFPYEIINLEIPTDQETRKKNFYNFIEHLLSFWTSYRHYSKTLEYTITVISNHLVNNVLVPTTDNMLPVSHTCFSQIDIPVNYHDNHYTLYKKLVQAVYLGEKGIGNYGGGYKKTQYKFLERTSKKSKTIYKNKTNFYIQEKKTYKKLFSKKGGNPVKYVAVFCANSDTIRDKTMILMKSVMPDHDIIYTPMGTVGDQTCKVDVLSKESINHFLEDVQCSKLPLYAKFDAIIFENCPIMGIFQHEFFNDKTINIWKTIMHENAPFYLGFFTDANLEGIDFSKHAINKYMKQTNHYRILHDLKDLNIFEYKLL